jgi:hypothetical protein
MARPFRRKYFESGRLPRRNGVRVDAGAIQQDDGQRARRRRQRG